MSAKAPTLNMTTAVLVAPLLRENTLRYVRALAELEGCRAAVITQDDPARLPSDLKPALAAVHRIGNCMDGAEVGGACRTLVQRLGGVDRLLAVLEQAQVPAAEAREAAGIPGLSVESANNFRDKSRMKEVLRAAGLPVARSRRVTSAEDARAFARDVGFPIVVKPLAGVGSKDTHRVNDEAGLAAATAAFSPSPERPLQFEEFVTGVENTLEAVTIAGRPAWYSGTRYLPGPLTVLENPWIQYCVLLPREEREREFAEFSERSFAAVKALGLDTGLTHMEWFRRADGSSVISEVGARPPGVQIVPLISLAHGFDLIAAWVRLMVHGTFSAPPRTRAAGAAFLRGQGEGSRVVAVHGVAEALAAVGPLIAEARIPQVGRPRAEGYEGEGHVILTHPRTEVVAQGLKEVITKIRVVLG